MPSPGALASTRAAPESSSLASFLEPPPTPTAAPSRRLLAKPAARFIYAIPPGGWEEATIDGKATWLPKLKAKRLIPGCDNMRTLAKGEDDDSKVWSRAHGIDQERGWLWLSPDDPIPAEFLPPGVPAGGYCRRALVIHPRSKRNGVRHLEAWDVPVPTPRGTAQRFRFDHERFNRWRAWIAEQLADTIGVPTEFIWEERQAILQEHVNRAMSANWPTDEQRRVHVERARKRLEALPPKPTEGEAAPAASKLARPSSPKKPRRKKRAEVADNA